MILLSRVASPTDIHEGESYVQIGDLRIVPGVQTDGVVWNVEPLNGWDTPAEVTERLEQRNADHGGWLRRGYYQPRDIELRGGLYGHDWAALSQAWSQVVAAVPSFDPVTLTVATPGSPVLQTTVVQGGSPILERTDGWTFSFSLLAADPRRYSTIETVASTAMTATSGGLSLPLSLPLSLGATKTSGVLTVTNEGDMPTRPTLRVFGPCPPLAITHSSGRRLVVPDPVGAGQVLTIDTDARSAVVDGTATRVVTGTWFELEPGVNEIQFSSASYDPAARLSVSFRSAWR